MTEVPLDTFCLGAEAAVVASAMPADGTAPRRRVLSGPMIADAVRLFDLAVVLGAGLFSHFVYGLYTAGGLSHDHGQYALGGTLTALLFVLIGQYRRSYQFTALGDFPGQLPVVAGNLLLAGGVLAGACFLMKISTSFSRGWVLLWIGSAGLALALGRGGIALALKRLVRAGHLRRRRAVIGEETAVPPLLAALREGGEEPVEIVRVFSYARAAGATGAASTDEDAAELVAALRGLPVDEIIVACPESGSESLKPLIDRLKVLPADIRLSLPSIMRHVPVRSASMAGSVPVIDVAVNPLGHWQVLAKSVFDFSLALLLAILLAPALAIIALLIKLDSRGPVLFVQERFGFNNNVIRVIKFRTMYVDRADPSGACHTVRGDARVTRIGRRLRAHSLDELPQLFNVLRGEMSLVGPRPHALAMKAGERLYHEVVSDYFARHRVKPGITGWAQVNGLRGEITSLEAAQQRVDYDLYYIDHWSIWLDLGILLRSVKVMFDTKDAF
ncbi:MAG TPA: exopolysaccharide biosynthesis polyprenyl glycosylphosphotransferase [Stellaceae bacterium]|nr:exopolysaccharide biosynthesis polyprenyl glycosylphosphotransferase [Stellaceae bacterium]